MEQNRRPIVGSNNRRSIIRNKSGQFAIEAVLLMSLFVSIFLFTVKQLKEKQILQKFTETSVGKVKTMAEYGAWKNPCKALKGGASQKAANCHPNSINRALSSDPL